MVRGGVWQFVYDTNRPAFFEGDMVGLCVNGNWQIWVLYCGGEMVSIHTVGNEMAGFSIVKSITLRTLKLVHGFAVSTDSYGVIEVSAGDGERVCRMVMSQILHWGPLQRWRLVSTMIWWSFRKVTDGFGKDVLG